jgi:hypothetical protein
MKASKKTVLIVFILLAAGCTTLPAMKPVSVGSLVFHNSTPQALQDVRLQVQKTGGFVSCNTVLPGHSCATTFPSRQYRGAPVVISWRQAGRRFSSGEIQIRPRRKPASGKPAMVIVTIKTDSSVNAHIE